MSAKFTLEGTGTGAVKVVTDLHKAFEKLDKGIELTAKDAKALETAVGRVVKSNETPLERLNRRMDELNKLHKAGKLSAEEHAKGVDRLNRQYTNITKSSGEAFGPMAISQIKNYVTGMVSVTAALGLVRSEIDAIKAAAEKATQTKLTVAGSEAALRQNIFALPPAERERLLTGAADIAGRLGIDQAAVNQAVAGTISATGDTELTLKLVETSGRFNRDPEQLASFAAALGDIIATTEIRDPVEALGFLTLAQAEARIVNAEKVATGLPKVTGAITAPNIGGTSAEAGALFAALTKGSADPTGELSRTGSITLASKMKDFFEKEGGFAADAIDTHTERISLLFNDKKLARKFIDSTSFEAGTSGAIAKLFLEDGSTRAAYDKAYASLNDRSQRVAKAEDAFDFVREGGLQRTARTEDFIKSFMQGSRLSGDGTLTEESYQELIGLQYRLHGGARMSAEWDAMSRYGLTMDREEAINMLTRLSTEGEAEPWAWGAERGEQRAKTLDNVERLLSELRDLQRQQLEETKRPSGVQRPTRQE